MRWVYLLFEAIKWGRVLGFLVILSRLLSEFWLARTAGGVESWLEAAALVRNRHGAGLLLLFTIVSSYAGFHDADVAWLRELRLLLLLFWTSHVHLQWFIALDPCRRWYLVTIATSCAPYLKVLILFMAAVSAVAQLENKASVSSLTLAGMMIFAAIGALTFCSVSLRESFPIRRSLAAYTSGLEDHDGTKNQKRQALRDRTLTLIERNKLLFEVTCLEAQRNAVIRLIGFGLLSTTVALYAAERDLHTASNDASYSAMQGLDSWRKRKNAHLVEEAIDLLIPIYWCIFMQPLFVDAPHTRTCLNAKNSAFTLGTNHSTAQKAQVPTTSSSSPATKDNNFDSDNAIVIVNHDDTTTSNPDKILPAELCKTKEEACSTTITTNREKQHDSKGTKQWQIEWRSATEALPGSGPAASLESHLRREANRNAPLWRRHHLRTPARLKHKHTSKNVRVKGPRRLQYDLRINIHELFIVDELLGVPVASLFAGRDVFVACFERLQGVWTELGRTEVLRNETNPHFCRCIAARASDDTEIELGLVVFNLNRKSSSSDPDPEWAAYSDGARRDFFPPVYIDDESLADHHPIAIAVCSLPVAITQINANHQRQKECVSGAAIATGTVIVPLVLPVRSGLLKPTRVGGDVTVKYRLMSYENTDIIARAFALPRHAGSIHHTRDMNSPHAYFGPLDSVLHHHHHPEAPNSKKMENDERPTSASFSFFNQIAARFSGSRPSCLESKARRRHCHRHDVELTNVVVNPIHDLDDTTAVTPDDPHHHHCHFWRRKKQHNTNMGSADTLPNDDDSTSTEPTDALVREELEDSSFAVSIPAIVLRRLAQNRAADAASLAKRYISEETRLLSAEAHRHRHKVTEHALTVRKKRVSAKLSWLQTHVADLEATAALYLRLAAGYECGHLAPEDGGQKVAPFRPSTSKSVAGLAFQPVNLQVQRLVLDDTDLGTTSRIEVAATCGCFAAHSLKFKKGGALELDRKFSARYRSLSNRQQHRPGVAPLCRSPSKKNILALVEDEHFEEHQQSQNFKRNDNSGDETKENTTSSTVEECSIVNDQDVVATVLGRRVAVSFADDNMPRTFPEAPVFEYEEEETSKNDEECPKNIMQKDQSSKPAMNHLSCRFASHALMPKKGRTMSKDTNSTSSRSPSADTAPPSPNFPLQRMISSIGGGRPLSTKRRPSPTAQSQALSPRRRGTVVQKFMERRTSIWRKSSNSQSSTRNGAQEQGGGLDDDDLDDDEDEEEDSDDESDDEPETPRMNLSMDGSLTPTDIVNIEIEEKKEEETTIATSSETCAAAVIAEEEDTVTTVVEEAHNEEVPTKTMYHRSELEESEWPQDLAKIPLDAKLLDLHKRLQRRFDRILSQALATLACCAKNEIERRCCRAVQVLGLHQDEHILATEDDPKSLLELGILVQFESLLSTRGNELSMIADYSHAVQALAHCIIVLVDAKSHPKPDVIFLEGRCDADLEKSSSRLLPITRLVVPINADLETAFGRSSSGIEIAVEPILFTQGINEMQSVANAVGDTAIQDEINRDALKRLTSYFEAFDALDSKRHRLQHRRHDGSMSGRRLDHDVICRVVEGDSEHDRKNAVKRKRWRILALVADFVRHLGGCRVTSCKSGKDRTGMSMTFEEARLIRSHYELNMDDFDRILYLLRLHGVRVLNAKKNVGKHIFAFNKFQSAMLPQIYRPPPAVANSAVVS